MKKYVLILSFGLSFLCRSYCAICQSYEVQQLLLDVEKLAQFKQMLSDLKTGYEILNGGYNAIKNISQGNFNLHQIFLDNLLQVSPAVQKYERIADIIQCQLRILKEGKTALNQFKQDQNFTPSEVDYLQRVYGHLLGESTKNLDDLITVITAGKLRMSDDERLKAIDHIWSEIQEQYAFLRDFNGSTSMLSKARQREQQEINVSKKLQGVK